MISDDNDTNDHVKEEDDIFDDIDNIADEDDPAKYVEKKDVFNKVQQLTENKLESRIIDLSTANHKLQEQNLSLQKQLRDLQKRNEALELMIIDNDNKTSTFSYSNQQISQENYSRMQRIGYNFVGSSDINEIIKKVLSDYERKV